MPNLLVFVTVTAMFALFSFSTAMPQSTPANAVCSVSAGTVGGKKFATLKCHKKSEPGNYKIRSTKWLRDGKKEYDDLARFSGRKFNCKMTKGGSSTTSTSDVISTSYKITNCR